MRRENVYVKEKRWKISVNLKLWQEIKKLFEIVDKVDVEIWNSIGFI